MLQRRIFHNNLPKVVKREEEEHSSCLQEKQMSQSHHHNVHTMPLTRLVAGQDVTVQHATTKKWQLAEVKEVCDEPRSYDMMTSTEGRSSMQSIADS